MCLMALAQLPEAFDVSVKIKLDSVLRPLGLLAIL